MSSSSFCVPVDAGWVLDELEVSSCWSRSSCPLDAAMGASVSSRLGLADDVGPADEVPPVPFEVDVTGVGWGESRSISLSFPRGWGVVNELRGGGTMAKGRCSWAGSDGAAAGVDDAVSASVGVSV